MKTEVGVPLAGGSIAVARERASATPGHHQRTSDAGGEHALRSSRAQAIPLGLRPLQRWFAAAVMHPKSVAASVAEGPAIAGIGVDAVERVVLPSSTLSGLERIDIYHQAYRERLIECLADDYPTLKSALGEPTFANLCLEYIAQHPSQSPNLSFFGRHLSAFCRARPGSRSAFAADLATLEWAMVEVVHEALTERIPENALAAIAPADWPAACFVRSPAVRVLEFAYPVNAYFQAHHSGLRPSVPEPAWSATAVFRDGATIWRMDLSRAMHGLIISLFGGATLGRALEALAEAALLNDEDAPKVMRWFHDWVRYGFFEKVTWPRAGET